jgi:folate-binding protein YgfZ
LAADVASLQPGHVRRSLLLTPTGRIRADLHVARNDDELLLLQPPDQPEHIGLLLHPYVLSSDVSLEDATGALGLIALPGAAGDRVALPGHTPSVMGPGADVVVSAGRAAWRAEEALVNAGLTEVGLEAVERLRIERGEPRMGADFGQDAMPAEVGLDDTIDHAKGCFLGQEAVAKVRNLGHPPRVLRHLIADQPTQAGDAVLDASGVVGEVTSAVNTEEGTIVLARIRWDAREDPLHVVTGGPLRALPHMG